MEEVPRHTPRKRARILERNLVATKAEERLALKARRIATADASRTARVERMPPYLRVAMQAPELYPETIQAMDPTVAAQLARQVLNIASGTLNEPMPQVSESEVHADGDLLLHSWCCTPQHAAHPNSRIPEDGDFILFSPDPTVYLSEVTPHIAIMHWHHEQRREADAMTGKTGITYELMEGPDPFGGLDDAPDNFADMHINPDESWFPACAAIAEQAKQIDNFVMKDIPLRHGRAPGGKAGFHYGFDALHPQWRRVPWQNVDGKPVPRRPALPDAESQVDMQAFYVDCAAAGVNDMEIVSRARLYGIISDTTAATGVDVNWNYNISAEGYRIMQAERTKKIAAETLGATMMQPTGIPFRNHPKGLIEQEKAGGILKLRPVTDAGSVRREPTDREVLIWSLPYLGGTIHERVQVALSKKGKPGLDSVNECVPKERRGCKYANFKEFTKAVDILRSSGVEVDMVIDDFASWYEQFAIGKPDEWYSNQIVSRHGCDQCQTCEFGTTHLPPDLNRNNFNMCELIDKGAQQLCNDIIADPSPWSRAYIQKCVSFSNIRIFASNHGKWWTQFPWFDDNAAAVLRPMTYRFKQLRYDIWEKYRWEVSLPKAAMIWWHHSKKFDMSLPNEAIVGNDVSPQLGTWRLPEEKVDKWSRQIDSSIEKAMAHPRKYGDKETLISIIGRISSASEPIPRIWRHFGNLLTLVGAQRFEHCVLFNADIVRLLRACQHEMRHQTGRPLTSYTLRPGCDGFRIWQNWNDASRRDETFFGAAGGWFRLLNSSVIFYFAHLWPAEQVKALTIADLEMMAASIAAALQLIIQHELYGTNDRHYLMQYGDNSGVSDHVLQNMRARSRGLRYLAQERATIEDGCARMSMSKQVCREWNIAADHLANLDLQGFRHEMESIAPGATFIRLLPTPEMTDLSKVIEWTEAAARYELAVETPPRPDVTHPRDE